MTLTHQQLETIARRAFPGDPLRESRQAGEMRYELRLAGGDRLMLLAYHTRQEAGAAAAALRLLAGEFDLPLPVLRAADEAGETVGTPYMLVSGVEGEPLPQVRAQVADAQLYALGQRLGEVAQRFHRIAAPGFGPLSGGENSGDEHAFVLARLEQGLAAGSAAGLLNRATVETLRGWFTREFRAGGKTAALVHGALSPDMLLVRRSEDGWRLSGLLGWEHAQGWSPVWEHVALLEGTDPKRDFALRVGYGNAYDANTKRAYEQVREAVLRPYRVLYLLEQMQHALARGEASAATAQRNALVNLIQVLTG